MDGRGELSKGFVTRGAQARGSNDLSLRNLGGPLRLSAPLCGEPLITGGDAEGRRDYAEESKLGHHPYEPRLTVFLSGRTLPAFTAEWVKLFTQ